MEIIRAEAQRTLHQDEDAWVCYIGVEDKLEFAILVLKIREFITSKTCTKKLMQKKSVARMARFSEKPRNALQHAI